MAEKFLNSLLSSVRVQVEHAIAGVTGVKRCRIVKDLLRLTLDGVSERVMEIACALHNLRVSHRRPLPELNLLDLRPYF